MEVSSEKGGDFSFVDCSGVTVKQEYPEEVLPEPTELVCVKMEQQSESGDVEVKSEREEAVFRSEALQSCTLVNTEEARQSICPRTIVNSQTRRCHKGAAHSETASYVCRLCCKTFLTNYKLKCHMRGVHQGFNFFKCDLCEQAFSRKNALKSHIISTHEGCIDLHMCGPCGISFLTQDELQNHTKSVHLNPKPYTCSVCGKGFLSKLKLGSHIDSVHLGLKPYQCELCIKLFSRKFGLTNHLQMVHGGVKCSE